MNHKRFPLWFTAPPGSPGRNFWLAPSLEVLSVRIQTCNDSAAASNHWQVERGFYGMEQGSFLTGWKGWCQRATLNCTIVTSNTYFRENLRPSEGWKLHLVGHGPQLVPGAHLTQFTCEAPPNCSHRLFNHSAQIIQRVSPQSPCLYVRDFLSLLCVVQRSISLGFPPF